MSGAPQPAGGEPTATSPFAPPIGRRPSIEWVPPAELEIDAAYQRSIDYNASRRHIRKIAESWDWTLFGFLLVSRRPDDRLFVVDGQHRLEAARLRGDIDMVPCSISRRAGASEEAALFIAANRTRRSVATLDDFHAALAAGDPESVLIARVAEEAGLKIARAKSQKAGYGPNELGHITGLRQALKEHGEPVLRAALANMAEAFPDESFTNGGAILAGLVEIHAKYEVDPDQLFATLLERTTAEWSQAAGLGALVGGRLRRVAVRDAILARYRVRTRAAA